MKDTKSEISAFLPAMDAPSKLALPDAASLWEQARRTPYHHVEDQENLVLKALSDDKYRARTISGISTATKLDEVTVLDLIRTSDRLAKLVKIFPVLSQEGKVLLTTRKKFDATATVAERFVDLFSSKRVDLGSK